MTHDATLGAVARPSRAEVAARLAPAVVRITRRIRPVSGELSAGHFSTLATLDRFGPQRPGDLARVERVSAPTMTRVLSALEDRGLLRRTPSVDDARSVTVAITAEGERLVHGARAEQAEAVAALLRGLDDEQLAQVAAALRPLELLAEA